MTEFAVTVSEHCLPNGLKVLVVPYHQAPVVSVWSVYRVGSRHEQIGITGVSHWVEHMLFKGTPKFPKGQIARLVQKHGGVLNGSTSYDCTAYYETLPKDNWLIALDIEADRMTNALFDPQETELERGVILSELEMYENHPEYRLFTESRFSGSPLPQSHHRLALRFGADGARRPIRSLSSLLCSQQRLLGAGRRHYA